MMRLPGGKAIRSVLELALTRTPGLYARLVAQRRMPNFEKVVFLSLIRRGDVVMDVGANTGYYSILFSHLVGPHGSVHAFEPVPPTFAELQAKVQHSLHFRNVVLSNCALADEEKTTVLFLPGDDHGQAALTQHKFGSWAADGPIHTYSSSVTTLDAYIESRGIRSLSFVKCDVEGAELLVLRGASRTISRFTPLLFLEISHHWTADFSYKPEDIVSLLETLGYSRFFLITDRLIPISEGRRDLDVCRLPDSANLLCVHGGHNMQRLAQLRPWLKANP